MIEADPEGGNPVFVRNPESEYTDMDWEIYPEGLFDLLVPLRDDYAPPRIYVTIDAIGRAVEEGVPAAGYFVWSLLDNLEWAHGYSKRFGIVYVDYPTLERAPKESYS